MYLLTLVITSSQVSRRHLALIRNNPYENVYISYKDILPIPRNLL